MRRRMNLGCGRRAVEGWFNCDLRGGPGIDLAADLRLGLPLPSASFDCIVAIHLLQDLAWQEIGPALREIRRLLCDGGLLRLGLPDLDRALKAYLAGEGAYFHVPESDARDIGAKLVTQLVWYGSVRTPCNFGFIREQLQQAGFSGVRRCGFGQTGSRWPLLASLDNRERESFFVEASR